LWFGTAEMLLATCLVEPLAPRTKSVFGRLQTFAQLGRAPARLESKCVLRKSKPERGVSSRREPRTENFLQFSNHKIVNT
jgi:hypothetical protein